MKDCIFCKIGKGEIPCDKVYEDDNFLGFLDINPFTKGHTLLIPKKHAKWVWELLDKEYSGLFMAAKKIAKAMQKAFNTEWVVEGIAGIDVPHAHVHIIPREMGDGLGAFPNKVLDPKPSAEEMKEIAEKIKNNIE